MSTLLLYFFQVIDRRLRCRLARWPVQAGMAAISRKAT